MTIKELAYSAQQHLHASTGISFKRSHLYELLAASFGYKSFAAFSAEALFADAGVGVAAPSATPELIGRVVQLGYHQSSCALIAEKLVEHATARHVSVISWRDLLLALTAPPPLDDDDYDSDDWEDHWDETEEETDVAASIASFLASRLLLDGLDEAAARSNADAHLAIAALYRCDLPSSYLYEESLKGRTLNKTEQGWADAYLQNKPRFEKYKHHLRQAAIGGVRQAAAEFAEVFDDDAFYALADRGTGPVDARRMVKVARSLDNHEAMDKWLRFAGEEGSRDALQTLGRTGDAWALRKLAESGDIDAIRKLAEMALETDLRKAWIWQHLAESLGTDLTKSTMGAYHDGGPQSGEPYDDDFGGPLYLAGDEGLGLKPLDEVDDRKARELAHAIFARISQSRYPPLE